MTQSIVDRLSESRDAAPASETWTFVMSPLRNALLQRAETDPNNLYVPASTRAESISYHHHIDTALIRELPTVSAAIVSSSLLYELPQPVVLLGDAGVGKSSWISYFRNAIQPLARVHALYYSQKHEAGRPLRSQLSATEKFHAIFYHMLVSRVHEILRELGDTDLSIFQYSPEQAERGDVGSEVTFTRAIEQGIKKIYSRGCQFIVIIDDLDIFDDSLQVTAFKTAAWLAETPGVNIILPMRPFTYHARKIENAFRPMVYRVLPPSLKSYLLNRKNYEFHIHPSEAMLALKDIFDNRPLTLDLVVAKIVDGDLNGLERFYERLIDALSENEHLERALYSLQNRNVDEISVVLSQMLGSRFFEREFRGQESGDIPPLKHREKIITSYLRGPYRHYRGHSDSYPIADISIFNAPAVSSQRMILPVRLLSYLLNREELLAGLAIEHVRNEFDRFGYPRDQFDGCVGYLKERGLLFVSTTDDMAEVVGISSAGKYLVTDLMSDYAFRFCDATADVYRKPLPLGRAFKPDKGFLSMAENAVLIFEMLLASYEGEVDRVLAGSDVDVQLAYLREVATDDSMAGDWLYKMFKEIDGRIQSMEDLPTLGVDERNGFRLLRDHINTELRKRLTKLRARLNEASRLID